MKFFRTQSDTTPGAHNTLRGYMGFKEQKKHIFSFFFLIYEMNYFIRTFGI